jgi:predicted nuclease of predicted toxin-antitoxin system
MRFLVDECTGPAVARWLPAQGHEVFSVFDEARGLDDDRILSQAFAENRILITNDKDFGEKIYREQRSHQGIVLMRLEDERPAAKVAVLHRLLRDYSDRLIGSFLVVTETQVRFGRRLPG